MDPPCRLEQALLSHCEYVQTVGMLTVSNRTAEFGISEVPHPYNTMVCWLSSFCTDFSPLWMAENGSLSIVTGS